ncbi:ADAMTS-like protein 1 [Trichomycterus rosablanca]|uniref:ADAMTS-like protein 1 n=1 Tax=Trichomycterus rosablanca TaxID=2290929 RepID=UPI002F35D105
MCGFVPGPWSSCSVSCGVGLQRRRVKCQVFLSFTRAEVELPEEECGEEKPALRRSCTLPPCPGPPDPLQRHREGPNVPAQTGYVWEYRGFTACSASCAVGEQDAVIRCVTAVGWGPVEDSLCGDALKPPAMTRMCNPQPCPARWEAGVWNPCSVPCGAGLQTRTVWCVRGAGANRSESVSSSECGGIRPAEVRACNQVECGASWETGEWLECSSSCGSGTQWRKVYCRQRLATGSFRRRGDDECDGVKPETHRPCVSTRCLQPQLVGGEWSKCSVSCGKGIQRREPVCRRQTASGQLVTLDRSLCVDLQPPPLIRSCRMSSCTRILLVSSCYDILSCLRSSFSFPAGHKFSKKRCPRVLGLRRIYIQTRQEKRLSFTVGGRAYLLPKTSVVVKCPVRHFPKSQVRWEKDGVELQSSERLSVTKSGALRIYSLDAADIGQYRCWANQDSDVFTLKLIGHDNKLLERPDKRSSKTFLEKPPGFGISKCQDQEDQGFKKIQKSSPGWFQKNELDLEEEEPVDLGNHLLASRTAAGLVITADSARFEELLRNISTLAERVDVTDDLASQLITRLMKETAAHQVKERPDGTPNSSEGARVRSRATIVRDGSLGSTMSFQRDLRVDVGSTAYVTNATRSLTLLCPARGDPTPTVSWSKDGRPLRDGVSWDSGGALRVVDPGTEDAGTYRCTASNEMGSDSETTRVLWTEPPSIAASRTNVSHLRGDSLNVAVGGRVRTRVGANVTLDCLVTGVPQPSVSWHRVEGESNPNVIRLTNGSLLLYNLTLQDDGTYVCTASNAIGKSAAATAIHVTDLSAAATDEKHHALPDLTRRRVVMASRTGSVISVRPGDALRIGCPVVPSHRKPIKWTYENRTLEQIPGAHHRTLAAGRILEVSAPGAGFEGRFSCQTLADNRLISAWIHVLSQDLEWRLAEWSVCSASCGSGGSQSRRVHCTAASGREMPASSCRNLPRPSTLTRPCNLHDCPPSWVSTVWSECSASCGGGFRRRRVWCQLLEAGGSVRVLPDSACEGAARPEHREPCVADPCAEWITGSWGQCFGRCLGPAVATQRRAVTCRNLNGSDSNATCDLEERPPSVRNCTAEMCDVHWRASPWRTCTATCGNGFQSRRVECVHRRNNKTLPDLRCSWQHRPASWQHCSITSCGNECKDTTRYCAAVRRLGLCSVEPYTRRCCQSCSKDSDST